MSHPLLREAFDAFDQAGVRWCLLRAVSEAYLPGDDVDLLVSRSDLRRAEQILEGHGFVRLPAWGRGSHTFFLTYHPATDCWIELDIVTELAYGPDFALRSYAEAECLIRRRREGTVFTLDPDDAFWALFLHCLLDKGNFAPPHRQRLQALAGPATADGPLAAVVEAACPTGWTARRIRDAAAAGAWGELAALARPLARRWMRRDALAGAGRAIASRTLRALEKPLVARRRRGLSVALLGPDGAGKSTLAAGIIRSFYFPTRLVYMGLWQRHPARRARAALPGLEPLLRPIVIWRRYLTAQFHQLLGRMVIFDRYTYDALLPPDPPLMWLKRLYFRLLAHVCPPPDLVLVLDAPGEVMFERKGETSPARLEAQRTHFLELRDRLPRLQVLDSTRPEDAVRIDAVQRIWREYRGRLGRG